MERKRITVSVEEFAAATQLNIVERGIGTITLQSSAINRPGLQFSGYFSHFAAKRVQIIGNAEMDYLRSLDKKTLQERLQIFIGYPLPCIIFSRDHIPPAELLQKAQMRGIPVFRGKESTTNIGHNITNYIDRILAPTALKHGVLMDVFGVGVLFTGESGIGKSETALELLRAGHRLVADDVVQIRRDSDGKLIGSAPDLTRYLMEIRGLGVLDIRHLYGVSAIIMEKEVDMVLEMEMWQEGKNYERLDAGDQTTNVLGVDIAHIIIPVRPGRNIATIAEVAARNYRLKNTDSDAVKSFGRRWRESLENH